MQLTCGWELFKHDDCIVCAKHGFIRHELLEPEVGRKDVTATLCMSFLVCLGLHPLGWHPVFQEAMGKRDRHKVQTSLSEVAGSTSVFHLSSPGYKQAMVPPTADESSHFNYGNQDEPR